MRFLFAIGQTPFDPTSGAALATLHLMKLLARAGHNVASLSTSATEGPLPPGLPTGSFKRDRISFDVLPVPDAKKHSWAHLIGKRYDRRFKALLAKQQPHWLITFGDEAPDRARRQLAQARGTKVLFALHNEHYTTEIPPHVDRFLTPSVYLENRYRTAWNEPCELQTLPTPMLDDEVIAPAHEPVFCTFVNPQPSKGLFFFLRLASELAKKRPDIPLLIVGSRATAEGFAATAQEHGLDPEQYPSIFIAPPWSDVRELWKITRLLIVPSVWNEPAGRLVVEAALNHIPTIISDRGGLPEQLPSGGAHCLKLPPWMTPETQRLPTAPEVAEWFDLICRLTDDTSFYEEASARAHQATGAYRAALLTKHYEDLFAT